MLVPLNWLKEYVEIEMPAEELAALLTASGSSVERIMRIGVGLDDLIVGQVLKVKPHPNADRLRLAEVNTGSQTVSVVCGAPNLATGQKIVFAPVGASVPVNMHDDARRPFTLSAATIRGVESQGMICSAAELGLGDDHTGILVLPSRANPGEPAANALGYPQVVFDIEVTTNRADELSIIGVAREVAALTGKTLKMPANLSAEATAPANEVKINDAACVRLMAQSMRVEVGPSPEWMQRYLRLSGMRPINNVVDITNFVMLEFGQPMHAYDTDRLDGDVLEARAARPGESITTLDGTERPLQPGMLVISDQESPVGIAGIMGGMASKIDESTKHITLEAAVFDPISIRQTANRLALRTEASRRFERLVDRSMTPQALARACDLLGQYADAEAVSAPADAYPSPLPETSVTLSEKKLTQYTGKSITLSQADEILRSLGFMPLQAGGDGKVRQYAVPSWRQRDVEQEEDLIEETVRMVGYHNMPTALPGGVIPALPPNREVAARQRFKHWLACAGYWETLNLSLVRPDDAEGYVAVSNPLSAEWTHLRRELAPSLLGTAARNARQSGQLKLFELSDVYEPGDGLPEQRTHLAILLAEAGAVEAYFMALKGLLEELLMQSGITNVTYEPGPGADFMDQQGTATIVTSAGTRGWIGRIARQTATSLDLPEATVMAELDLTDLLDQVKRQEFTEPARFPSVTEDISLLMDEGRPLGPLLAQMRTAGGPLLESLTVSEVYRHANLGAGKKAPLLHLVFRAADRTLGASEIATLRSQILESLHQEGIDVRE